MCQSKQSATEKSSSSHLSFQQIKKLLEAYICILCKNAEICFSCLKWVILVHRPDKGALKKLLLHRFTDTHRNSFAQHTASADTTGWERRLFSFHHPVVGWAGITEELITCVRRKTGWGRFTGLSLNKCINLLIETAQTTVAASDVSENS